MLTVRGTDIEKTKNMGSKTILRIRALLCGGGGAGSWSGRMVKLFTVEPGGPDSLLEEVTWAASVVGE